MDAFSLNPLATSLAYSQAFLLVFFRMAGIFERMPVIGGATVPRQIKVWLAFLTSGLIFPIILDTQAIPLLPQSLGHFLLAVAMELSLGLLIGFIGSLMLAGLQLGGRLVDDQMGFSLANVVDPLSNESVSITSQLVFFAASVLFIVMGGLKLMIWLLAESFQIVKLIHFHLNDSMLSYLLFEVTPQLFLLAVIFAAPALIVVLLSTVALGLIGKVVPEMNIFSFSFGIRVFAGLAMLTLSMRYMKDLMVPVVEGAAHHVQEMLHLSAMKGG